MLTNAAIQLIGNLVLGIVSMLPQRIHAYYLRGVVRYRVYYLGHAAAYCSDHALHAAALVRLGKLMDNASKDSILSTLFNKTDLTAANAMLSNCTDRFDELSAACYLSRRYPSRPWLPASP